MNSNEQALFDILADIPRCGGCASVADIEVAAKEIVATYEAARDHWQLKAARDQKHIMSLQGSLNTEMNEHKGAIQELFTLREEVESLTAELEVWKG